MWRQSHQAGAACALVRDKNARSGGLDGAVSLVGSRRTSKQVNKAREAGAHKPTLVGEKTSLRNLRSTGLAVQHELSAMN
eukprot:2920615-Rhodomonas_salina.2